MIKKYNLELEGQRDFYDSYLKLIDNSLTVDEILSDNTDGVLNGNLLEFKIHPMRKRLLWSTKERNKQKHLRGGKTVLLSKK